MKRNLIFWICVLILTTHCSKRDFQNIIAKKTLQWKFPLKRTHTGMLIGNGVQGIIIWGYNNQLNITVGRAGFWDHRGGNDFASRTTYQEVKQLLYDRNEDGLRKVFTVPSTKKNDPPRPQQIGGGRLEIHFPEGYNMDYATLILDNGTALIQILDNSKNEHIIKIRQSMFKEISWIEMPDLLSDSVTLKLVPTWNYVGDILSKYGVQPPEQWEDNTSGGFLQSLPDDDPLAIVYKNTEKHIIISSSLGSDAKASAVQKNDEFDLVTLREETNDWWKRYWQDVPSVRIPDAVLQEIFDYGLYKLACVTPPQGLPCSLQGPFNEEYQLPPWSNDYHFNINIEMIYWPVLYSNRLDHLNPLWDMILSWWPELSSNGEKFFEQKGAIMLPHAVDDRCKVVGTFWTGTIDHACTAWMAQLAWEHYRYSMNMEILEKVAWPLMVGAFEGYWAMLEESTGKDGIPRLSLPVSVSPEFKGSRMDAWGRDASFQLAALHMIADNLGKAALILGKDHDPRWKKIQEFLPPYTTITESRTLEWPESKRERIALWEGMDLIESHRHHSYLGGIWPFMTFDPLSENHEEITRNTIDNWIVKGPGLWSGWCVPWASIIHSRLNNVRGAIEWLHWWKRNFTNEGRGTLHNAAFQGTSLISSPDYSSFEINDEHREIMQLDAGFGALTAVYEILVQDRLGVIHVMPGIPNEWKNVSFNRILTEGGFLISAKINNGIRSEVNIIAQHEGSIRIAHGMGEKLMVNGILTEGSIINLKAQAGQEFILTPI